MNSLFLDTHFALFSYYEEVQKVERQRRNSLCGGDIYFVILVSQLVHGEFIYSLLYVLIYC